MVGFGRIFMLAGLAIGVAFGAVAVVLGLKKPPYPNLATRPTPTTQVPKTGIAPTHSTADVAGSPESVGVYSTHPDDAELDASGKVSSSIGTVTALALRDKATGLFARLTYHDALLVAARLGAELLSEAEEDALAKEGLLLDPVILPPTASMGSLAWAKKEDAGIQAQLDAKGWDGKSPVSNLGKDWIRGAPPGRAINRGWYVHPGTTTAEAPPAGKLIQTTGGAHNDAHTDYSQLTRLIWRNAA